MRAFVLLLTAVAVTVVGCAGKPVETAKADSLHKFNHVVPKHSEVCVAATEEDIAALF
ncbi:MAG: hypothetical protein HP496_06465, partial [Nitrospira sp.]|nr:hypothetical protein [Nitrospira sp.]